MNRPTFSLVAAMLYFCKRSRNSASLNTRIVQPAEVLISVGQVIVTLADEVATCVTSNASPFWVGVSTCGVHPTSKAKIAPINDAESIALLFIIKVFCSIKLV